MKKFNYLAILLMVMIFFISCNREDQNNPEILPSNELEGALSGKFSVSESKQIRFSRGNLQYQASTDTWRFAEHQSDIIGEDNRNIRKDNYDGWIDLFGFGTASHPMTCIADNSYYGDERMDISAEEYRENDWGWHNKISNGGNKVHIWRTLTREEFIYLMQNRPHANDWTFARVNGILGIILVPDDWEIPQSINYIPRENINTYSISEWEKLEETGAVFLPAAGSREIDLESSSNLYKLKVILVEDVGTIGYYWTSTSASSHYPWRAIPFLFNENQWKIPAIYSDAFSFLQGYSVRLVQDVK
ncbi:MAG: hypothetical protein IKV22_01045 [Paludibacteraceae bacterium]|nr:hypothetical protein [Paludibacteraceae bacterium]